ncbi:DUF2236 domain-containing protein [Panacibacter ginsenosidivorans]|uniref:DUF2236 domain-containing protein n=1 Tax=Panacibacter ginsenosidivorans TaxID=1813871 RepID=A0A5B8VBJ1_9BACT|nr:oxygenase MpaB family protein [Panacibacter ginsenosidivorans]QEC68291.1 DUF2236 domain-containing protein [Panacibacter ginsenosidivorans]
MNSAVADNKTTHIFFVEKGSIVRAIWGKADTILFIFAGSAAEFALNKAVDWLYFTGKLPADPLGRLFSTVSYARQIVFADKEDALRAIDRISAIHAGVEKNRGSNIPDWAYRDVLFMLIDYSIRAYESLERKLTAAEKEDVFRVFYKIGLRMNLKGLPHNFNDWLLMRKQHLEEDLASSYYTLDLFKQYKKHLGAFRYTILLEVQKLIVPKKVRQLLQFSNVNLITPVLASYKLSRKLKLDWFLKSLFLPADYKTQIKMLDQYDA